MIILFFISKFIIKIMIIYFFKLFFNSHYSFHGRHGQAAYLMELLAHSEEDTDINQRIIFFTRAINSASQASVATQSTGLLNSGLNGDVVVNYTLDKLEDLKEKLQIAGK